MGFTPPRKVYVLDFADTELDGLEVRARSAPVGMMLQLGQMVDAFDGMPEAEEMEALEDRRKLELVRGSMDSLRNLVDMYAQVLISWNYEDEHGEAVPATAAGLLTLDPPQLMMIIRAWQQAVSAVPPASSPTSSGGALSEVPSIPMEPLSPSLAS